MPRLNELNQLTHAGRVIDGRWTLTPQHQLQYRRKGSDEEVLLKANVIAAEENALIAQILEHRAQEDVVSRTLTLRGRWEADANNRLHFLVERRDRNRDRLTFAGGWELNDTHELRYRFESLGLKTKTRQSHTVTFRGAWEVDGSRQLTYVLDADTDSVFRLRGTFQTASLNPKQGMLRYQLGIEAEKARRSNTLTFFGKWKLSRDLSLELELAANNGKRSRLKFGASYALDKNGTVTAALASAKGDPLGMELILTRQFMKGKAEGFIRLRRSLEEQAAEAGFRYRW